MEEIIKYYCDLLIMQYRSKPKAKETIEALVKILFASGYENSQSEYGYTYENTIFALMWQDAYDLDIVSGVQLDTIGKYFNLDRTLEFVNYTAFQYREYDDSVVPLTGYNEYGEIKTTNPYREYDSLVKYTNEIGYDLFKKIIKMRAFLGSKVLSLKNIEEALYYAFGEDVYVFDNSVDDGDSSSSSGLVLQGKVITYVFNKNILPSSIVENSYRMGVFMDKYMPRPMGCKLESGFIN